MNKLEELAISAHGGMKRWREFNRMSAHQLVGGVLWPMKGQDGVINDAHITVELHREWASHTPFGGAGRRSVLEPTRVAIESSSGGVLDERHNPRNSFIGHTLETPWDSLQLAYFAGYAMWTYLTTPFLLPFRALGRKRSNHGRRTERLGAACKSFSLIRSPRTVDNKPSTSTNPVFCSAMTTR